MIIVGGLSPAWQKILEFDRLSLGEVNRARDAHWCASGKVLNVGIALAHLKAPALTVCPLGGPGAGPIESEFHSLGAAARWISTVAATRVCTTLLDSATTQTTELVENAAALTPAELDEFESAVAENLASASAIVFTGSLPRGTPSDLFARLLRQTPAPAVLDIRGAELVAALATRPKVVKPNREELGHTVGHRLETDTQLRAAMLELNVRGAEWVVVSQGKDEVWASSAERVHKLRPPTVKAVNPIGSGDCLTAGIAWSLSSGAEMLEALRTGIAAGALNATQLLPGRLCASDVQELARSIEIVSE